MQAGKSFSRVSDSSTSSSVPRWTLTQVPAVKETLGGLEPSATPSEATSRRAVRALRGALTAHPSRLARTP